MTSISFKQRWEHIKSLRVVPRVFHRGGTYVRRDTRALQILLQRASVKNANPQEIESRLHAYKGENPDILLLKRKLQIT